MPQPSKMGRMKADVARPSSATREVIAVGRKGGRITKKRIVEATKVDPRTPPIPSLDDISLSSQVDSSQPSNDPDKFEEPPPGNPSRSVSVSATRVCHVVTHSPASRPKSRSGFHTDMSSSMKSFTWKLFLSNHPAQRIKNPLNYLASCVNILLYIAVSAVFRKSWYARVVWFCAM